MSAQPQARAAADVETPWRRLDPRMLVVGPVETTVRLIPLIVVVMVTGQSDAIRLWSAVGIAAALVVMSAVRWGTTRYRISADRVELHSGWLRRRRRSVPRDRIRTVDLTARLLHRLFGLAVVQVGAASGASTDDQRLSLDAVSKIEAERLRRELLDRSPVAAPVRPAAMPVTELARLRWSWLRFAPLTFSSVAGVGAVGAALFNLVGDLGVDPRDIGAVDDATSRLAAAPLWVGVLTVGAVLAAVAVTGSLLVFVERWYGFRLSREPSPEGDGTLRVRRGLLTRRSLSVAEHRMRGVEVAEPLLLRAGRGAQTRALATGVSGSLLPPAPRAEAHRVASAALREHPAEITLAPLRRHPRAALRRRLTRALAPAAVLVGGAFLLGSVLPAASWLGPASLVLLPAAALVGLDRFRNLGHQLTARYLVTRHGSIRRRTVALHRAGVIGWTFRQSVFQRRAGLVTVEAVTAAGAGGYQVLDVNGPDGVALADAAVPGILTPFLVSAADASRTDRG